MEEKSDRAPRAKWHFTRRVRAPNGLILPAEWVLNLFPELNQSELPPLLDYFHSHRLDLQKKESSNRQSWAQKLIDRLVDILFVVAIIYLLGSFIIPTYFPGRGWVILLLVVLLIHGIVQGVKLTRKRRIDPFQFSFSTKDPQQLDFLLLPWTGRDLLLLQVIVNYRDINSRWNLQKKASIKIFICAILLPLGFLLFGLHEGGMLFFVLMAHLILLGQCFAGFSIVSVAMMPTYTTLQMSMKQRKYQMLNDCFLKKKSLWRRFIPTLFSRSIWRRLFRTWKEEWRKIFSWSPILILLLYLVLALFLSAEFLSNEQWIPLLALGLGALAFGLSPLAYFFSKPFLEAARSQVERSDRYLKHYKWKILKQRDKAIE